MNGIPKNKEVRHMIIETHTTDRKALAQRISELLNAPVTYAGAPSFAYRVGDAVTIDRVGNLEVTGDVPEALRAFMMEQGWMQAEPETSVERVTVSIAAKDITVVDLKNLTHMLYSKQYLLNRSMGAELLRIPKLLVDRLQEYTPETPEAFTELLDDCRAMDELTGFDFRDGRVSMDIPYSAEERPEHWVTYADLLNRMITAAQDALRVAPTLITSENEKYAMRSWLLRLGYGGSDLKARRRILLENLKGYAAFRDDSGMERHKAKYAELRRQEREARG